MKLITPIFFCLLLMAGSAITYCANASEWYKGTDADINFVMQLVVRQLAVMEGNPTSGNWRWKLVDKRGC